jgi:hypothetical protein
MHETHRLVFGWRTRIKRQIRVCITSGKEGDIILPMHSFHGDLIGAIGSRVLDIKFLLVVVWEAMRRSDGGMAFDEKAGSWSIYGLGMPRITEKTHHHFTLLSNFFRKCLTCLLQNVRHSLIHLVRHLLLELRQIGACDTWVKKNSRTPTQRSTPQIAEKRNSVRQMQEIDEEK